MTTKSILLINPPVTKPCEPPAGPAKLAAALRAHGIDCRVVDASLDGLLGLLEGPPVAADTWTRRASAHRGSHLRDLRDMAIYGHRDRYRRAVMDLNRLLQAAGRPFAAVPSLANYRSSRLTPVRSADLIQAAEDPAANPFHDRFAAVLTEHLTDHAPQVIGVTINFMSQALGAFAIIGWLRRQLPRATIVCGGGLVSSWLTIPGWRNPFSGLVDEMVGGPGEARLIELCVGVPGRAPCITGIDYSDADLDRCLAPLRVLPYSASRGCYWKRCAFCPEAAEQAPYRTTAPVAIADDLDRCLRQTGAGLIHFLDNAMAPGLLTHLAEHPPGVPWYGFARISRRLADETFARRLKAAGCVMLKLGLESGDQAVLDALDKGIDVDVAAQALTTLHRAGIATYVYLLFGTPAEDERSARRTLNFVRRHAAAIDFLNVAIFNLPAHGDPAGSLATDDFYTGDLGLYREFVHPRGWDRDRVRRFLAGTFKKDPAIRPIIMNNPPFFTSNHAPFFHLHR